MILTSDFHSRRFFSITPTDCRGREPRCQVEIRAIALSPLPLPLPDPPPQAAKISVRMTKYNHTTFWVLYVLGQLILSQICFLIVLSKGTISFFITKLLAVTYLNSHS